MKSSEFNPKYRYEAWDGRVFVGRYYCPVCDQKLPLQSLRGGAVTFGAGAVGVAKHCYRCGAPDSIWEIV